MPLPANMSFSVISWASLLPCFKMREIILPDVTLLCVFSTNVQENDLYLVKEFSRSSEFFMLEI